MSSRAVLTNRGWVIAMAALFATLAVSTTLPGLPGVVVNLCAIAGFLALLVDRTRALRVSRERGRS